MRDDFSDLLPLPPWFREVGSQYAGRLRPWLKAHLEADGRSSEEVSLAIGWPKTRLPRLLQSRDGMTVEQLYAVLAEIGVPPSELIRELGEPWLGSGDRSGRHDPGLDRILLGLDD